MPDEQDKREDIAEVVALLSDLTPVQVEVVRAIIQRFAGGFVGELLRTDFLNAEAFEFFGVRLAAHHAYSSKMLKKENFEHALEQAFRRANVPTNAQVGMTVRGADLGVGGVTLSLKTEAAQNLRLAHITISKLMEAAWIKEIRSTDDIPGFVARMVVPHFGNYDRIFILRGYVDKERSGNIRYDLHEIPKALFERIGLLKTADFLPLTNKRSTRAEVKVDGATAFVFRLDGSDDKLTINYLDVRLCPMHAWWSLAAPD